MFSREFGDFLKELLTSWQVIAATVVVVLYIALVNYITHFNTVFEQPKAKQKIKKVKVQIKKKKKEKSEENAMQEDEEVTSQ
ncbi:MAG: hypothetical protein LBP19_01315 [Treponema sp.]|jgi:type IV secretory pathway VirB6-like protein|nr:hypothetical protein [Treponema sp.]